MFERYQSMRNAYGEALEKVGRKDPRIFVLDADLGESLKTKKFAKAFPDRYVNVGVSEQLMIGMAAAFAYEGRFPITNTFACFNQRAFEFIKLLLAAENLPSLCVGSHGGLITGKDGHSAQEITDIAVMRAVPNLRVVVPADALETRQALGALIQEDGPGYLRLVRTDVPDLPHEQDYQFHLGRAEVLHTTGQDRVMLVACGPLVANAYEAATELGKEGLKIGVTNMASVDPPDMETLVGIGQVVGGILTLEDGGVQGLGGAVKEALAEHNLCPVKSHGVNRFGESGDPKDLYKKYRLDPKGIMEITRAFAEKV